MILNVFCFFFAIAILVSAVYWTILQLTLVSSSYAQHDLFTQELRLAIDHWDSTREETLPAKDSYNLNSTYKLFADSVNASFDHTRSTTFFWTMSSIPILLVREFFFFFFFNSRFYPVSIDIILRNQFYALSVWALLALLRGCADVASGKVSVLDHCKTGEEQVCNFPVTYSDSVVYRVQSNETGSSESGSSIFLRRKYSGYKS